MAPQWTRIVGAAALLLLTGCTAETSGDPAPTAASGTSRPSADAGAAPEVPAPLQPGRYLRQPCALLTTAQVNELGVADDRGYSGASNPAGAGCSWTNEGVGVDIAWETINKDGLDDIYAQRDYLEYFEPTRVAGFPAVFASAVDARASGDCVLHVGINDRDIFFVKFKAPDPPLRDRSCAQAQRATGWALETLRSGR